MQRTIPRHAPGRTFNIATELIDRHVADGNGARPALWVADRRISYAELLELSNRTGNALRAAGVQPEQRVVVLLADGWEFVASFLGALKIGAVPVPLNTGAPLHDLQQLVADSRATALVCGSDVAAPVLLNATLQRALVVGGAGLPTAGTGAAAADTRISDFGAALAAASPELEAHPTGVDEPCYWLYSSGTTGPSKAVVHLHGDMLACVAPFAEQVVGIQPADITFSVARLFFSYGLVNSLFLPLLAGASAALDPARPTPAHILAAVRRHRPTLLFGVPTAYVQLNAALASEPQRDAPFASVRLAISAGEPLPEPVYSRWKQLTGIELLDGLGSTEVGYIFCSNLPGQVRAGSSGLPLGTHQLKLVDENEQAFDEPERGGELWVRAASTALHYWNQRERTKQTFVGEWLRTGDRFHRDADGFYWYEGRIGDMFKVSGQWVSPMEVESCLLEHPAVLEAAVVGAEDDDQLLRPKAFVVLRSGMAATADELQAHVRGRLLPHKYPRWVAFVDELPKTASGKVQRFQLRILPQSQ